MIRSSNPTISRAPCRVRLAALLVPLTLLLATPLSAQEELVETDGEGLGLHAELPTGSELRYTTYFYTAAEALVYGYEDGTQARIVSMQSNTPIWEGTLSNGAAVTVPTGSGVFAFYTTKKAGIFVGTPSSCTVIGYFVRDQDGMQRSSHFLTQVPPSAAGEYDRMVVWAAANTHVTVTDLETEATLHDVSLSTGQRLVLPSAELASMRGHRLEFSADSASILVQLYQDEGFTVPALNGTGVGREFLTYVGGTTEGVNDLDLISYHRPARITVQDIDSEEVIWEGQVEPGAIHTLTMTDRFVRVTSDVDIAVFVAPFAHYGEGYAEHHYSMGAHGTGMETDFLLTTPGEIWLFSYFNENPIQVINAATQEVVWTGTLEAGSAHGLFPGHGFFRVRSELGISVMGGSNACGGEYSPAAEMFQVDEALLAAVVEVRAARMAEAAATGTTLREDELNAPLDEEELETVTRRVRAESGNAAVSPAAVEQRLDAMIVE